MEGHKNEVYICDTNRINYCHKKIFFFFVHIFIELLNAHVCACYWKRNGIS